MVDFLYLLLLKAATLFVSSGINFLPNQAFNIVDSLGSAFSPSSLLEMQNLQLHPNILN